MLYVFYGNNSSHIHNLIQIHSIRLLRCCVTVSLVRDPKHVWLLFIYLLYLLCMLSFLTQGGAVSPN